MNLVVFTTAMVVLLCACSSHQSADIDISHHRLDSQQPVQNAVEIIPQQKPPTVPLDGRLRDEHLQMYVSVKIKQEQIRYDSETSPSLNQVKINNKVPMTDVATNQKRHTLQSTRKPNADYEKMAVEDFEFNTQLYFWAKQTIAETLEQAAIKNKAKSKYSRASNFQEYVITHNLQMVEKYHDQLRFVENYKLQATNSRVQHAAKIGPDVADRQTALILKPSS
ncbi:hypothetical protein [Kaarinaea lacus]